MAETGQELTTSTTGGLPVQLTQLLGEHPWRKLGLIAGLVAAVAAGIALFVWAQKPVYRPLYGRLSEQDAAAVVEALRAAGAPYQLDQQTGTILVPAAEVYSTRLRLASQGLPQNGGTGYELLQREQGFGTSQFMESARFNRALETELARSISGLQGVESARVHLALPKQSVFIRERSQPSASVLVNLLPGRGLTEGQVAAVVHMVASSVPELTEDRVTVLDQRGRLLTRKEDGVLDVTSQQLEYKQHLEDAYVRRIENLLTPMMGAGRVRAQVDARVDFTMEESTYEVFDPDSTAVRSEQLSEQQTEDGHIRGVPGALTNQPPQAGTLAPGEPGGEGRLVDFSRSSTRNYEISKTIRHSRRPLGVVERLSVAVLVDEKEVVDADGNMSRQPFSQEELDRISQLVQQAVGFDAARGDAINVISVAFQGGETDEGLKIPLLEQPWVLEGGKLLLAALLALVLIFAVVRPLIRGLLGPRAATEDEVQAEEELPLLPEGEAPPQLPGPDTGIEPRQLPGFTGPASYEETLTLARQVVSQEPAVAASVVKGWLEKDE